jgi:hypothetical protein
MQIKSIWSACIGLGLALIIVIFLVLGAGVPEPKCRGVGLSQWLDGTMIAQGRANLRQMLDALDAVDPAAIPWLIQLLESRENIIERLYFRLYMRSGSLARRLPMPRHFRSEGARFNGVRLLSRLAPGTEFENSAVRALLSLEHQGDNGFKNMLFYNLGSFTNFPDRIVPVLLTGVTNPPTFDASVEALKRFGTWASPSLYRMAQSETGHIRPAGLALEKIDASTYQSLCDEKAKNIPK